jgi:hypothetical protein
MSHSRLLWILYDQRVLLPQSTCRLVCTSWRDAIDARKEVLLVNKMHQGGIVLSNFLAKLTSLKAIHFDRQFRKISSDDSTGNTLEDIKGSLSDSRQDKKKPLVSLREREEEKIQDAIRALSMCRPVELSLTFCRLSLQDLDTLLKVLSNQVQAIFSAPSRQRY